MPNIPNFPPELLEEHRRWHHANHYSDPSQLPPGYGQAFLDFHRQYIAKVRQWYTQMGYDPRLIAAWPSVPEAIRATPCFNRQAEARVANYPQSFATADELGRFIEASNLHGCIHQETARIYGEPALNDFDIAPQSTLFHNIHWMIDNWYRQWETSKGLRAGTRGGSGGSARRTGGTHTERRAARGGKRK